MKCSHRVRENPETFLFKEEYGAPCSSLPRFTSSSQPSASVLVTALWWCREAESTFPSHSGLGIGRSYPLLFRQDFCPSHSLKLFMSGWGQSRQLLWPIPQLSEVLDPLGCTQHQGIAAAPQPATSMPWSALCLSLRKTGRGPSGALCVTAVDVLLLFALCLRQRFLLLDPPILLSQLGKDAHVLLKGWSRALAPCALWSAARGQVLGKRVTSSPKGTNSIMAWKLRKPCIISFSSWQHR